MYDGFDIDHQLRFEKSQEDKQLVKRYMADSALTNPALEMDDAEFEEWYHKPENAFGISLYVELAREAYLDG